MTAVQHPSPRHGDRTQTRRAATQQTVRKVPALQEYGDRRWLGYRAELGEVLGPGGQAGTAPNQAQVARSPTHLSIPARCPRVSERFQKPQCGMRRRQGTGG